MISASISRRRALAAIAGGGGIALFPGFVTALTASPQGSTESLLDAMAWRLLQRDPEQATSLGIDTGANAALRSRLGDRSRAGRKQVAQLLRGDLARLEALDPSRPGPVRLDPATRTSIEVARSAYRTALDGFALPYGDVAVGGWRNTPYVVIQNAGAYLDTPRFLDSDHPVRNAADAEAYLSRLGAMAGLLDGELGRIARARRIEAGSARLPARQGDWPDAPEHRCRTSGGGDLVQSLVRRAGDIPGAWERRAKEIVAARVLPAMERQLAELHRPARAAPPPTPACGRGRMARRTMPGPFARAPRPGCRPAKFTSWAKRNSRRCMRGWTRSCAHWALPRELWASA